MAPPRPLGWVLVAGLLAAPPVLAQEKQQEELTEVEKKLAADQAKAAELKAREQAIRDEIAALTKELVAVAAKAQALEGDLTSVEQTAAALGEELAARQAGLAARRAQLAATLGALVRIALQPPEAVLAEPASPLDAARSALLLSQLVPELEKRAASLRRDLDELVALQQQIAGENLEASAKQKELEQERARLEALLERKEALAEITAAERTAAEQRAAKLADQAADLKQLIAELEREAAQRAAEEKARAEAEAIARAKAEAARLAAEQAAAAAKKAAEEKQAAEAEAARLAAEKAAAEAAQAEAAADSAGAQQAALAPPAGLRDFPDKPGGLFLPARGTLQAGYGQPLPDGSEDSKGLLIQTRPGAQIVATFDGRVVYAGAFRRYGLILILEHGGRYHSLLAGLGRIDVVLGQWVVAGEPVGLMGSPPGAAPALYIELRHNGQPIDPTPWFGNQLSERPISKDEG